MKKHLLILFSCIIYHSGVAQTNAEVNPVRQRVHYGFKVGLNYANMNFNKGYPTPATPVKASWRPGFLLGFFLEVPLPYNFSLQQEYLYTQINGTHQGLQTQYGHSYLSLPLLLKYRLLPKVVIMAGPQFELLIAAQEKANGQTTNTTHETEERSIGFTAGLGFRVSKFLSLNARFMHGFNHIGITQRTNALEYKYELLQIATDFRF
ncbi:outer membrane beta-barrel protein [Adhaeribacter swui]|uniref:Outer membrane beta-barrel protein n=1 Tax=Adhaeribacter swui TaxID=2086471 RepID=A0A7G7GDZ8_9BACT|nr:outer membrane beta-barrel protein [Adhaeribacter swui]QNF35382.1 outer membrane beta-barrel protein [Adhaeribacter swui]